MTCLKTGLGVDFLFTFKSYSTGGGSVHSPIFKPRLHIRNGDRFSAVKH